MEVGQEAHPAAIGAHPRRSELGQLVGEELLGAAGGGGEQGEAAGHLFRDGYCLHPGPCKRG